MRILEMARWYFPHVGGAAIRVHQVSSNLSKSGNYVHVLVHNPQSIEQCNLPGKVELSETNNGVKVTRLKYLPFGRKGNWLLSIPIMAWKAFRIIRHEKIDVILSHNPPYLIGMSSVIASKLSRKPLVVIVHDVWGASHYGWFKTKIGKLLEEFTLHRADSVITVSEGLKKIIKDEYGIDSVVAPTGIDSDIFYPKPLVKRDKGICFVGIMREWAGVQYLIQAFAEVHKKHKESWLLLVGGGGDQEKFETLVKQLNLKDSVIFSGTVPYNQVPNYIAEAEVCVAPFPSTKVTDQKNLMSPHKVLEYMACGKPVVASSVGGMENYIQHEKTGLLVTPNDVKDLTEKVNYLLENPDFADQLGKNAHEFIKDHTWKASTANIECVLLLETK